MGDAIWSLVGLFLVAFSAATLLPGGSEVAFVSMVALSEHSNFVLLAIVSIGNSLGSVMNYGLGRFALHYQDHKCFPISPANLVKAQSWFERWGKWSILLAWVPLIGDPLTFAAGVMRMNIWLFSGLVLISKTLRYIVVLWLFRLAL